MKNISPRIQINVDKTNYGSIYEFKQEDDGVLKLSLYKGKTALDITGQTIRLGVTRPDKSLVELTDGFVINNNELDITLKNSILKLDGNVECDLELSDSTGKMTTASFFITVKKKVLNGESVQATNEFDTFTKTVKKIEEDYTGLRRIIIDENQAANLQDQVNKTISSLEQNKNEISKIEINNLYLNQRNIECYFKAESLHMGEYKGENAFNGDKFINSMPNVSGWINNGTGEWIEFYLPFGVVIGDSIAEGHPNAHGRLHTSTGTVELEKVNEEGQISYYFEKLLNMKIYNHGIGGQLTDSILSRFDRDVLGKDVVGLVPTRTLNNKCKFCVVVAGTNDILNSKPTSFTINNLEQMIRKCEGNNIYGVFYTLGVCQVYTSEQISKVKEINKWLKNRIAYSSHCSIFDYFEFVNDSNNEGKPKNGIMADGTHPTKATYSKIADKIYNENLLKSKIAILPRYLNISTLINPDSGFSGLARPNVLKIEYSNGVKKVINTNNVPLYQDEIPRNGLIETAKITIISGIQPSERISVDLRNYAIGEIYCSDILDKSGILGVGNIISVPTLMDSIGADRIMLSPTTYSQADNIQYIYGVTLIDSTIEKTLCNEGICRIETIDICNEGDYIITTLSGRGKKATDLTIDKPIAKCIKNLGSSGSYYKCLAKLL